MNQETDRQIKGKKNICIPCNEEQHEKILNSNEYFKNYLNKLHDKYPEIFPKDMKDGYMLYGYQIDSKKLGIKLRRIRINSTNEVYSIRPSFLMPYMTSRTDDVEKAMFFRRFNVPYWAITYVFGRNDMYWYRMELSFGRNSIVGTTVKDAKNIPKDLIVDEKHTKQEGNKVYIANTVAGNCILGASISKSAGEEDLTEAYKVFKEEAENVNPEYSPETVNTDGWLSTMNAIKELFPMAVLISCFLHVFLSIKKVSKKKFEELFSKIKDKVWKVYRAENKRSFIQRIRRLKEWAEKNIKDDNILSKINKLYDKKDSLSIAYDYPNSHRTSNMLERLMRLQDQYLFNRQYFHGSIEAAELEVRAWAILRNFQPYCSRRIGSKTVYMSAAVELNGFKYSDNWLENILISASMCGYRQ